MKRVLLTIIFCLFVSSMANAQSAWVLWESVFHNLRDKKGKWELKTAFPTYNMCLEACETEVRITGENMERLSKALSNVQVVRINPGANVIVWDGKKQEFTFFDYQCFPDTIDPRK